VGGFGLDSPTDIIADTTASPNIMWVANSGTGGVSRIVNDGTSTPTGATISGSGETTQKGITLDNAGDVWVSNSDSSNGSVTKISGTSVVSGLGQVTVGGITSTSVPWGIAADSKNNVFVNNFNGNSITELDVNGNALSPAGGFTAGGLINAPREGIAIDRGGNVWVVNSGDNTVTELIGAAGGPVATPLSTGRPLVP
jgi:hypothetical protein